jgi:hypothetical protein
MRFTGFLAIFWMLVALKIARHFSQYFCVFLGKMTSMVWENADFFECQYQKTVRF